jgi:hypothetical protein
MPIKASVGLETLSPDPGDDPIDAASADLEGRVRHRTTHVWNADTSGRDRAALATINPFFSI